MQLLVTMPHHHHEGNYAVCLDLGHCLTHEAGGHDEGGVTHGGDCGGTCDGSHHDGGSSCCEVTVDLTVPGGKNDIVPDPLPAGCDGLGCLHVGCNYGLDVVSEADACALTVGIGMPPETPLHTEYIVAAIPARAPSFTA